MPRSMPTAIPAGMYRPISSRARFEGDSMPSHPLTVSMALDAALTAASTRVPAAWAMPARSP